MSAELVLSSAGVLPVGACRRSSPMLGLHVRPHPKSIERSPGVVLVFFVAGRPAGEAARKSSSGTSRRDWQARVSA